MVQRNVEIEEILTQLPLEELLQIQRILVRVVEGKLKEKGKEAGWKEDFLHISQWSHLDDEPPVKVNAWKIETF